MSIRPSGESADYRRGYEDGCKATRGHHDEAAKLRALAKQASPSFLALTEELSRPADAVREAPMAEMLATAMETEASLLVSIVGRSISASDVTLLRQGAAVIREQGSRLAALAGAGPDDSAKCKTCNGKGFIRAHGLPWPDDEVKCGCHAPAKAREVTEADVCKAISAHDAYWEAQLVGCPQCSGKGHHHGFGEDGSDPDWCGACGGSGITSAGNDNDAMRAALATFAEGGGP